MRTTDFARVDADRTVALSPLAAIEQHGRHLPLSTEGAAGLGWVMRDVNPDGACGNAAAASAAKGERLLNHLADRLVALLGEVAQHALP